MFLAWSDVKSLFAFRFLVQILTSDGALVLNHGIPTPPPPKVDDCGQFFHYILHIKFEDIAMP